VKEKPIKFCACGCGKQIPPDEVYPDKGPQFLDECWNRRPDIVRLRGDRSPAKKVRRG